MRSGHATTTDNSATLYQRIIPKLFYEWKVLTMPGTTNGSAKTLMRQRHATQLELIRKQIDELSSDLLRKRMYDNVRGKKIITTDPVLNDVLRRLTTIRRTVKSKPTRKSIKKPSRIPVRRSR